MSNSISSFARIHARGQEITLGTAKADPAKYEELFNEATMDLQADLSNLNIEILENFKVIKNVPNELGGKSFDFYSVKLNDVNFIKHASKGLMERTVKLVTEENQKSIDSLNKKLTEVDQELKTVETELQNAEKMVAAQEAAQKIATTLATFITEGQDTLLIAANKILATLKDKIESNDYLTPLSTDLKTLVSTLEAKILELEDEKQKLQEEQGNLKQQVTKTSEAIAKLPEHEKNAEKSKIEVKDLKASDLGLNDKSVHFGLGAQSMSCFINEEKSQKEDNKPLINKSVITKSMFNDDEGSKLKLAQAKSSKQYTDLLNLVTDNCTKFDNGTKSAIAKYKTYLKNNVSEFSGDKINSDTLNTLVKDYITNKYDR